jgi:FkbM family methyltransferase
MSNLLWRLTFFNNYSFRRHPFTTLWRLFLWEIFKIVGYKPTIKVHTSSLVNLSPGKKRGIHAFIYIFRNNYEPQVSYAIESYVKKSDTCYDIGANIGFWALKMGELVGESGKIYAFEPMSQNLSLLELNINSSDLQKRIEILPFALGDKEGSANIYIPADPGSTSMAPESIDDRYEEVNVKTLDDVWQNQGCPQIKFIKMDVEGYEPFVLQGGKNFFQKVSPIVVCEINSRKLSLLDKSQENIFDFFLSNGYQSFVFNPSNDEFLQSDYAGDNDYIFLPPNYIEQMNV